MKRTSEPKAVDAAVLPFTKMHGAGNDFVVIDGRYKLPVDVAKLVPDITDRRFGVGADGLIIVEGSTHADFKMLYFNRDGSRSICGNGMRCAARFIYDLGLLPPDSKRIRLEVDTGIVDLEVLSRGRLVKADMGRPTFDGKVIPTAEPGEHVSREFQTSVGKLRGTAVSVGNPHVVFFVEDLASVPISTLGPELECHPFFPEKTNVEFVRLHSEDSASFRVWERGVGETLACGTAVCAVLAAGVRLGMLTRHSTIASPGGRFQASMPPDSGHIFLTGPAETVYKGELLLTSLFHRGEESL